MTNREWNWIVVLGILIYTIICCSGCATIPKDFKIEIINTPTQNYELSQNKKNILLAFEANSSSSEFDKQFLIKNLYAYPKDDLEGFLNYIKNTYLEHYNDSYVNQHFDKIRKTHKEMKNGI